LSNEDIATPEKTPRAVQHLLLLVESAQRAGHSEAEIAEIVESALASDAELNEAA
jgi:hypothetical protein